MPAALALHPFMPYAGMAFVGWMFYRRVRRNFGPQAWKPRRAVMRVVLVGLLSILLVFAAMHYPQMALPMLGAAVVGVALGVVGLRHTHAEWHAGQRRYMPNRWVGGILTWRWQAGYCGVSRTVVASMARSRIRVS